MESSINLVFLGGFDYPNGMAGTRRIQHMIDGLKNYPNISIKVIVLRQSSKTNSLNGVYEGIDYETIMGDVLGLKMAIMLPFLVAKSRKAIKKLLRIDTENVLFVYGPPHIDNLHAIQYAKRLGFKIIFDIVEDFELSRTISRNILHQLKIMLIGQAQKDIKKLANGIVVISSHLEKKFYSLTLGDVPIFRLPVSVDMDKFFIHSQQFNNPVKLFYAGSYGVKDGIPVLIEAFEKLAAKRDNLLLIMTGIGSNDAMRLVEDRIACSRYKHKILYKGFLDQSSYYKILNEADILCMPRIDIGYAHAGFPFKLGEYLATGKPVVASMVSDLCDILQDQRAAMLVAPGSSDAIVNAVNYLIDNPINAFEIGKNGKEVAKKFFDYRSQGVDLLDFILGVTRIN